MASSSSGHAGSEKGFVVQVEVVPVALRNRLGPEATVGFVECVGQAEREWKGEVVTLAIERFEHRLAQEISAVRLTIAEGNAALRAEMLAGDAALRVEMREGLAALRTDMRDGDAALRVEMHQLVGGIRQEIATTRVELLRWSFVFWVGQTIATAGLVVGLVKLLH